jgi:hypothetical protein
MFFLFFAVIALFLTIIWLGDGIPIGYAEGAGLYYSTRSYNVFRYLWEANFNTGRIALQTIPTIPFLFFMSFLEKLGLPFVAREGAIFWFVLTSAGYFMFCLTLYVTEDNTTGRLAALFSGVFYILNPYSMTFVWKRFIWASFIILPLLPLTLYFYIRGVQERSIKYAIFMSVASVLLSFGYGQPAMTAVYWLVLFSYFIFYILLNVRKNVKSLYIFRFSAIFISLWVLCNFWWLLSTSSQATYFFQIVTGSGNVEILKTISQFTDIVYIFRLIVNPNFIYSLSFLWGPIYNSILFLVISFLIPFLVFMTPLFKPRNRFVIFFFSLSLLGLFFAKGLSPPLGWLFEWLFNNIGFLGVLRNPIEKAGMLISLGYAPLFGIGLSQLYAWITGCAKGKGVKIKLRKLTGSFLLILVFISVFVVYLWPMWTGDVFTDTPILNPWTYSKMKVPSYYEETDTWISTQEGDFRIIHLPMVTSVGVKYNWTYGYIGEDISWMLFQKPSISGQTAIPFVDDIYLKIPDLLTSDVNNFWKLLSILNVKYVVLHNDIDANFVSRFAPKGVPNPGDIACLMNYTYQPKNVDAKNASLLLTPLIDSESIKNWSIVWAENGALSLDYNNKIEGNASIVLIGKSQSEGNFGLKYDLSTYNWSKAEFLHFWVNSNITSNYYIEIRDESGNRDTWDGRIDPIYSITPSETSTWKHIVLPLNKPTKELLLNKPEVLHPARSHLGKPRQILFSVVNLNPLESLSLRIDNVCLDAGEPVPINNIRFVISFDKLYIYENEGFVPHIYASNRFIVVKDLEAMFEEIKKPSFHPDDTIIFIETQPNVNKIPILEFINDTLYKPDITFKKVNPTKYTVQVNSSNSFFLVFSESYHKDWVAYVDGQQILNEYHFVANGYANAWYINKTGTYTITLEFWPQKLFYIGSSISITTLILCILYISKNKIKTIYKRYIKKRNGQRC